MYNIFNTECKKILGICNQTYTGKGTYTRALCQKNEGSVKTKQRPVKMGGRTTYRTLSPKRTLFQIGIDWWSHLRKVPRRRWISHTHPVWLWGCSPCRILSPGPVFHGTKWLLWHPHIQSPTLHLRCGINKGLIKREAQQIIEGWGARAGFYGPSLYIQYWMQVYKTHGDHSMHLGNLVVTLHHVACDILKDD
jgi:hypothetical protein